MNTTLPKYCPIEISLTLNGYFDLTADGFDLVNKFKIFLEKKQTFRKTFIIVQKHLNDGNLIHCYTRDKKYNIKFGYQYVSISFEGKSPNDDYDIEFLTSAARATISFLKNEFQLVFDRLIAAKETIVTGLSPKYVDNGIDGVFISKYFSKDIKDWDISFCKDYKGHHAILGIDKLIEHFQIYSSTLLRTNERIISVRSSIASSDEKKELLNCDCALDFSIQGLTVLFESESEFLQQWIDHIKKR